MSKVVCELCGTSYPQTATRCPICGCVRAADAQVIQDAQPEAGSYTYVKGGRFSKANVRKRSQAKAGGEETGKEQSNKKLAGLLIVLLALVVILAFMIAMIVITWNNQNPQPGVQESTGPATVACQGISLSHAGITLTQENEIWILETGVSPADCTDPVFYSSSDPSVATVSETGKITCIGAGETVITVTCGQFSQECKVKCEFVVETEPPTLPPQGITLNRKSITADFEGYSWILYSGEVPVEDIVWTSDDPSVATFVNGEFTAVGEGTTMVHADYNGVRTSCQIVCNFQLEEEEMNGEEGETAGDYKLYSLYGPIKFNEDKHVDAYDVTVPISEGWLSLFLKDSSGNRVDLEWKIVEGEEYIAVKDYFVKAVSSRGNGVIQATYNGVTYTCYIRTAN